ncbi:hypothetical protein JHK85_035814 [Glycine max]|nr:hypothetical protein JHK85_035814 [Glycine max]KAG4975737.1 hypothetical protein JHK86_035211 [Glycine max]
MLDEGFIARLGDFGLARQTEHDKSPDATMAAGTMGYLAPEYVLTGRASEKTDVLSYGVVVLEVANGRRPIEKDAPAAGNGKVGISSNFVEWIWSLRQEGKLLIVADPRLEGEFEEGEMRKVLLVGLACSHPDSIARPTMRGVVQMLLDEAEVLIVPRTKPLILIIKLGPLEIPQGSLLGQDDFLFKLSSLPVFAQQKLSKLSGT